MKEKVLVTIITVCYNSDTTIARTIESVLRQTYNSIEYVIIDGASKDRTLEIIESYQEQYQLRYGCSIRVISEPDKGIYDAMNKGIALAKGEMIGIINSDDSYEPNAIETVISYMSEAKMQICYGAIRIFEGNTMEKICLLSHEFLERRMIAHPGCFVTKSVYNKYGLFNTKYKSSADYEFLLRILKYDDIQFIQMEKIVANYYTGGISTTTAGLIDKTKMLYDRHMISGVQCLLRLIFLRMRSIFI